jgi:hypothetical protein
MLTVINILKNNRGLILIIVLGLIVLISTVFNNISSTISTETAPPPVVAPSTPVESEEPTAEETSPPSLDVNNSDVIQVPDFDVLVEDSAVDAAMAVVGFAYEIDYELSPLDMLAIMRPSISDTLYSKFERMYSTMDWDKIKAEKTIIYSDILESKLLTTGGETRAQAEILLKFVDGEQNPVKSRKDTWYIVDLERSFDFNIWNVTDVNIK